MSFNIKFPFTPKLPRDMFRTWFFFYHVWVRISETSSACYVACPQHFCCFNDPNNIWWTVYSREASLRAILSSLLYLRPSWARYLPEPHCDRPSFTPMQSKCVLNICFIFLGYLIFVTVTVMCIIVGRVQGTWILNKVVHIVTVLLHTDVSGEMTWALLPVGMFTTARCDRVWT
jgi:hypothetical protein